MKTNNIKENAKKLLLSMYKPKVEKAFVYKITFTDETFYIGRTTDIERRIKQHQSKGIIKKVNLDFRVEILNETDTTKICSIENELIHFYSKKYKEKCLNKKSIYKEIK